MGISSKTRLRVRYAETDKMGIVYHANYLIWFEVGRSELFRELNFPYTLLEQQGLALAVVEADCRYRKPTHYDDELVIVTELDRFSSIIVNFSYKVYCQDTLMAEGKTKHMFINSEGRSANIRKYAIWPSLQALLDNKNN